jgi:hypothetical protein
MNNVLSKIELEKICDFLAEKGGTLTGTSHPVLKEGLKKRGVKPNDFDFIFFGKSELECRTWIKTICLRYGLEYKDRSLLKDGVKVADLIFTRRTMKTVDYDGIQCLTVEALLKSYLGGEEERDLREDSVKIKILEQYISQQKPLSEPSPQPQMRSASSKKLLFGGEDKDDENKNLPSSTRSRCSKILSFGSDDGDLPLA